MRAALLAIAGGQASAASCCWSKWGDSSSCGGYPSGGSGGLCANDGVTKCSSSTDCSDAPAPSPSPTPVPSPVPISGSKVLLVGFYKDSGASVSSYAFNGGSSISLVSSADIGGSPSWITAAGRRDGKVTNLFAVSETGGTVASLTLGCDGTVAETSRVSSQGSGPVFVATDPKDEHVLCANYGAGSVSVLPVSWSAGIATLGEATQTLAFGSDAHAHSAYFAPGCTEQCEVFVPTLGHDEVEQLIFQSGALSKVREPLSVPTSQGPRHLAFHPTLPIAVLANEGSASAPVTIELLGYGSNGLSTIATYSASGPYSAPDMYPSEVIFAPDGAFVLVSVRDASDQKRDGVAVYQVLDSVSLNLISYTAVGHYPRSMALKDDGLLIVGHQRANSLSLLNFDFVSGALTKSGDLDLGDSPAFVGIFDLPESCATRGMLV